MTKASSRSELCLFQEQEGLGVTEEGGGKLGQWGHDVICASGCPRVLRAGREAVGRRTTVVVQSSGGGSLEEKRDRGNAEEWMETCFRGGVDGICSRVGHGLGEDWHQG